jgi:flavin reductase (DIM6/NTAB) family NADH-FMN oxidoreductase RutF
MYFYQPSQGHGLPHDPLNAIIGPRPIGWIASQDAEGQRNLAPYSFFNCFNYRPPIIGFASSGWKDSVRNIVETKSSSGIWRRDRWPGDERNVRLDSAP